MRSVGLLSTYKLESTSEPSRVFPPLPELPQVPFPQPPRLARTGIRTLVKLSMELALLSAMALTLWLLPNYKLLTLQPSEPSTLLSPRASGPLLSRSKSPRDQLPSPPQQLPEPPTSPSVPPLPSQPSASSERHESYDQYLHFSN